MDDLILVTPFAKLSDVAQSKYMLYPAFLLTERYDNSEWHYEESLLIVHGDNDMVIPNRFSRDLFESVPTKDKRYVLIEGRDHNDLWSMCFAIRYETILTQQSKGCSFAP